MLTSPLILFEHETAELDWSDRDLNALERLNATTGAEILRATVRGRKRVLKAKHYVGVIRFGRHTVQVLPKIYRQSATSKPEDPARQATSNLLHLLAYAGHVSIREQEIAPLLQRNLDWFEILTHLFSTHLMRLWQLGPYRHYQTFQEWLPLLKGKWRISRQLRRPDRKHKFDVVYDEFTADTQLNRVLRFVVERLWTLTRDSQNRQRLDILRHWMDEVTLLPSVTVTDAGRITLSRLNQQYEPLLNLARLFLDDSSLQLAVGDRTTFAFVFDMNHLFEAFVINMIRRHRADVLPSALRTSDLLPRARGTVRYLACYESRRVFRLEPDLAVRVGDQFPVLLDTKYKALDAHHPHRNISQSDFYQMYAYAQRYRSRRVILLYPQTADMNDQVKALFPLIDSTDDIVVTTIDLRVDLSKQAEREQLIAELRAILERGVQDDN